MGNYGNQPLTGLFGHIFTDARANESFKGDNVGEEAVIQIRVDRFMSRLLDLCKNGIVKRAMLCCYILPFLLLSMSTLAILFSSFILIGSQYPHSSKSMLLAVACSCSVLECK
jgi:hypothetical protein